eukprot:15309942-Alexandrium_andersonii.AAC.1
MGQRAAARGRAPAGCPSKSRDTPRAARRRPSCAPNMTGASTERPRMRTGLPRSKTMKRTSKA